MAETDFLINRSELRDCRIAEAEELEPAAGEAVLAVERFGMTANNVTYALFGDAMNYWDFFPAEKGWGRLPVWGMASVAKSRHPDLAEGTRLYGYLPSSSELLVVPDRVNERGFFDGAPHRAPLPSAYQGYRDVEVDPAYDAEREDEQILFWPLFYTSFMVDDEFDDEGFYGAETIAISSASSKTALIAAYLLAQRDGVELVGLTSERNREFVEGLGIYGETLSYEQVDSLPTEGVVYADFSGNPEVRGAVHEHCGDGLAHSAVIGFTHWDEATGAAAELPGPEPKGFFAPTRIRKRGEDWGTAELERRLVAAWHPFAEWTGDWLEVREGEGAEALKSTYLELLEGDVGPTVGPVHTFG